MLLHRYYDFIQIRQPLCILEVSFSLESTPCAGSRRLVHGLLFYTLNHCSIGMRPAMSGIIICSLRSSYVASDKHKADSKIKTRPQTRNCNKPVIRSN